MPWLRVAALTEIELTHDRAEREGYTRPDGPRRCVVRFEDHVADRPGTLRHSYRTCLDVEGPPREGRRTHRPRHGGSTGWTRRWKSWGWMSGRSRARG